MTATTNAALSGIDSPYSSAVSSQVGTLANGAVLFTIAGGPIQILSLISVCTLVNGAAATTIQYSSTPTVGSATTFSGASGSLLSVAAGTTVLLTPTALSTAPVIVLAAAGGVQLGLVAQNHIIVLAGTITSVVTNASTGAWTHYLNYIPLAPGVTVV